ncbi:MAG: WS/DGAT domain-containing protein [Rhizobacter sp.]|nr:WS/DGAT domain-containing protein [Rhizobacter sp.]
MRQLTRHDASFLDADTIHANSNVTFIQIYDQSTVPGGTLRFKTILAHIQGRLHRSGIFRSKLLRVPLELDEPYWVEDENFDLEYHVRHIALPKPGDWRQFCIQASRIHARALDLHRPLWEIYVIEGLDSITDLPAGSFALLTKIHHAAIDVESRNGFIEVLHDASCQPPEPEPPEPWFPESAPGALPLLSRAGVHLLLAPAKLVNPLRRAAPAALAFVRDLLRPEVHLAATRFNAVVSPHRVFDTRRFLLEEFERIRGLAAGATVNDAVLAVCAGGLRRYLDAHGELPQADLAAVVSLDIGADREPTAESRRIQFGTCVADPVQRLASIHRQTSVAAPAAAQRGMPPPSCTVTHVPGPTAPVYLHGARMTYFSAILPIADGMGLVFAVSGYDGRIVVSPTSCRELMPDPQAFTQCVRDSFQEYLALADALPAAKPRSERSRGSAADWHSQSARTDRSAATRLPAAKDGRRRSTAPRR